MKKFQLQFQILNITLYELVIDVELLTRSNEQKKSF